MNATPKKTRGRSGPRTLAGKQRSRTNSRKHGLASVLLLGDRSLRVEELRKHFLIGRTESVVRFLVREAAVARAQLEEVDAVRASILQSCSTGNANQTREVQLASGILNALDDLKRLERYERRALTRWLKSLVALEEAETKLGA
jgi:hypothetical protein